MKNVVSSFHIVLNLGKKTVSELISLAYEIKTTGDADVTTHRYTDAELQAQAAIVQGMIGTRGSDPHPALTKAEQTEVNKLSGMIIAVKGDVEFWGNKVANGNRAIFDTIAHRTGFVPQDTHAHQQRIFEFLPSDNGSFHCRVHSEGVSITYVYQYGITPAKDVLPAIWSDRIALSLVELIVGGFKSGDIVGVRYAAVMHGHEPIVHNRVLNYPPVNSKGKVSLTNGVDFLHFSDVIYVAIP
jgi:hypothetical protein